MSEFRSTFVRLRRTSADLVEEIKTVNFLTTSINKNQSNVRISAKSNYKKLGANCAGQREEAGSI